MLREGRRLKADDTLKPFNFKDPVQSVFMNPEVIVPEHGDSVVNKKKGATISPEAFEAMSDEFYALRRWNPTSGCQREETLTGMGLDFVVDEIDALGWLKKRQSIFISSRMESEGLDKVIRPEGITI